MYHRYERGLENHLGVLGLVLNCVTLWTTVYLDAAVRQLKARGSPVRDEDMARLSPFVNTHLGVRGTYSFVLPELAREPSVSCATRTPPARTSERPLLALHVPRARPRKVKGQRTAANPGTRP